MRITHVYLEFSYCICDSLKISQIEFTSLFKSFYAQSLPIDA